MSVHFAKFRLFIRSLQDKYEYGNLNTPPHAKHASFIVVLPSAGETLALQVTAAAAADFTGDFSAASKP